MQKKVVQQGLIGLNETLQITHAETFTPFGYIMSFSPESIAGTKNADMGSPVIFSQRPDVWDKNFEQEDRVQTLKNPGGLMVEYYLPTSLKNVIHHPFVHTFESTIDGLKTHRNAMNEIALFTAIKKDSGELIYPKIEGVFINPWRDVSLGFDFMNIYQNTKQYISLFSKWAQRHNLPIVLMNKTTDNTDYPAKLTCTTQIDNNSLRICKDCHGPWTENDSTPVSEDVLRSFGVDCEIE